MAGGFPKNFENPILTKSGEERYIVWQNNEVREDGKIVGTISFGIDNENYRSQGIDALVMKPMDSNELAQAIRDVLDGIRSELK